MSPAWPKPEPVIARPACLKLVEDAVVFIEVAELGL
jgi:hypothetical protein